MLQRAERQNRCTWQLEDGHIFVVRPGVFRPVQQSIRASNLRVVFVLRGVVTVFAHDIRFRLAAPRITLERGEPRTWRRRGIDPFREPEHVSELVPELSNLLRVRGEGGGEWRRSE